jgi:hypothetical protein
VPILPPPQHYAAETAAATLVSLIASKAPEAAILELEGSFCGKPAERLPSILLASALAVFTSSLEEGDLRIRIQQEVKTILQKAFFAPEVASAGR